MLELEDFLKQSKQIYDFEVSLSSKQEVDKNLNFYIDYMLESIKQDRMLELLDFYANC